MLNSYWLRRNSGDLLIVLSGSGNSPNVLRALEVGEFDWYEDVCHTWLYGWSLP